MAREVEFTDEFDGDKTRDDQRYAKFVPVADRLYEQHLDELRKEGKL